jgi:hypothetical protein
MTSRKPISILILRSRGKRRLEGCGPGASERNRGGASASPFETGAARPPQGEGKE